MSSRTPAGATEREDLAGLAEISGTSSEMLRATKKVLLERVALVAETLGGTAPTDFEELPACVDELVGDQPDRLWLAHAVIAADLPDDVEMTQMRARATLYGAWDALRPARTILGAAKRHREVRVIKDTVTCDVHATSGSDYTSGIQRVVRETVRRWEPVHDIEFLAWTTGYTAMRPLRAEERMRLFGGSPEPDEPGPTPIAIPWNCMHLVTEVAAQEGRSDRLLALGRYSPNTVACIGFDVIPVTSAATVNTGMTGNFARYLAAVRRTERIAMISRAAEQEFRGWVEMGAGRREHGPESAVVSLPVYAPPSDPADLDDARLGLVVDARTPMVLVVGSHEPRKNHLAMLHAAEVLWREGLSFNLVLVGAGSWNADAYNAGVAQLAAAGRPIQSIRGLPDRLLWAAYRLAHCTVFPSLNEGFGLPVAESLAVGTPVITSDFGSMRDIVAPDGTPLGGLLVDPRDDSSIADALRTLLTDPVTYERLRGETAQHVERTWDDYATELWDFLVEGVRPDERPDLTI